MKINIEMTIEEFEDYNSYRKDKKTIDTEVEKVKTEYKKYETELLDNYHKKMMWM